MSRGSTFPTTLATFVLASLAAVVGRAPAAVGQTRYTASWASVDTHKAAPDWFQDAKFGIYYHWGAFGVAAYGSEWYPRNMYNKGSGEYNNQTSKYGDPFSDWPYNKFITGGTDKKGNPVQFAPKLKTAGGNWDPDEWAQLLIDAGARFAGPVAEHHDGFSMWDSKVNEWNSNDKGPQLNLAKLQADAYRKRGLKFLMAMHHAYNFTGYFEYAPAQTDPSLQKLFGQLSKTQENQLWYDKLKEIIDEFLPDLIWEDFNLTQVDEGKRLQFLSYYYNAALDAGKEVVATYKDGFDNKGEVLDYERGGPGDISTPYWLTDDAVSPSSWCYTQGMGYYTPTQEVHTFVDHVSKGGNLLLNISPLPDGSIPQQQRDILTAFGAFLRVAGEAIYGTRAWVQYGEGPTKIGGGSFTGPKAMTASDIRYTRSNDSATSYDAVYAILGGWPTGPLTMTAVTATKFPLGTGKVFLFGPRNGQPTQLQATQDAAGLHVTLPSTAPYQAVAYAIKISKSGTPPAPPTWLGEDGGSADGGTVASDGGAGAGGADASGDAAGGAAGSGGSSAAGGAKGTGGASAAGGASGSAGASGNGGAASTGGRSGAVGGASASGGSASGGQTANTDGVTTGGAASGGAMGRGGGGGSSKTATTSVAAHSSSGCACSIEGAPSSQPAGALLLALLLSSFVLRRRRP